MDHLRPLEGKGWLKPSDGARSRSRVLLRTPDGRPIAEAERYVALIGHPVHGETIYGPVPSRARAEAFAGERCRKLIGSWSRVARLKPAT